MPPRKRAQAAPKPGPDEAAELVTEDDSEETAAEVIVAEPDSPDASSDEQAVEGPPERSDIQMVDVPCPACFPDGWGGPGVGARGCEHGTWQREATT